MLNLKKVNFVLDNWKICLKTSVKLHGVWEAKGNINDLLEQTIDPVDNTIRIIKTI